MNSKISLLFTRFIPKVSYFFISREKFNFRHFWAKIEGVSQNGVFFHRCFFQVPGEWVSEWNVNFFREKKKTKKCWEKKIHDQNSIMFENCLIYLFFDLFLQILFFFRVSGFQTFPRKKKNTKKCRKKKYTSKIRKPSKIV